MEKAIQTGSPDAAIIEHLKTHIITLQAVLKKQMDKLKAGQGTIDGLRDQLDEQRSQLRELQRRSMFMPSEPMPSVLVSKSPTKERSREEEEAMLRGSCVCVCVCVCLCVFLCVYVCACVCLHFPPSVRPVPQ